MTDRLSRHEEGRARPGVAGRAPASGTLWCSPLRACLAAFAALRLDVDRVRREAGFDAALLADPDARIPSHATARIWPAAQAQQARPGLGLHAGEALPEGAQGLLEYVFASAGTVGAWYDTGRDRRHACGHPVALARVILRER